MTKCCRIALYEPDERVRETYLAWIQRAAHLYDIQVEIQLYMTEGFLLDDIEERIFTADVLYLAVGMDAAGTVRIVKQIKAFDHPCEVIFLANTTKHIITAFDLGIFQYILKAGCSQERSDQIFRQVTERVKEKQRDYVSFRMNRERCYIYVPDIWYFEIKQKNMTVCYRDRTFSFYYTIREMEAEMKERGFIRVHRSFLVPVLQIERLSYIELTLRNGVKIPVGPAYYRTVRQLLQERYGLNEYR